MTPEEVRVEISRVMGAMPNASPQSSHTYEHWCDALQALHPRNERPRDGWTKTFALNLCTEYGRDPEEIVAIAMLTLGQDTIKDEP